MRRRHSGPLAREVGLWVLALIWSIPFFFLIVVSVKPTAELFSSALQLPSRIDLGSYAGAWQSGHLGSALVSSLVITGGSVLGIVALSSVAAYTLARREGRIAVIMGLLFLIGIVLPSQLGLIPIYSLFKKLHLLGTYTGLILLNVSTWLPLAVFLYTGFLRQLSHEYEEAAQIDGASVWYTFLHVVFPLLRPVTGTVAILSGILIWNDFFNPLVFLSGTGKTPLPVAVYSFVGNYATQWNYVFAAVAIALVPALLFFIFAQRQLIQGFSGGVKG
ncbi:sugar ABC transporter permease (plasmid) [Deinococcus aetherius]|uniref:Sugar ABC transporter permease n=1 Tax=Deinococcus aetherius TaxID=200252 RepID=A0ABM8AIQ7_9DEIO|nr:carbohydrate ABC transporter permease [Deinococcus aetherius]BDP43591.1 sugar ABC transporter permease [Deinococcus aetherius]